MTNHPNRAEPTPEQRREREAQRAIAIQAAAQVCQGSGVATRELLSMAADIMAWIRTAKLPENGAN